MHSSPLRLAFLVVVAMSASSCWTSTPGLLDLQRRSFSPSWMYAAVPLESPLADQRNMRTENEVATKKILFYTTYAGRPFKFAQDYPRFSNSCAVTDCQSKMMSDLAQDEDLGQFDAVIFAVGYPHWKLTKAERAKIDAWRRPHQRFIMVSREAPTRHWSLEDQRGYQEGFFNWTMTYRLDGDITWTYGSVRPTSGRARKKAAKVSHIKSKDYWVPFNHTDFKYRIIPQKPQSFHDMAKKKGKVAWIVSNCNAVHSKRNEYAVELAKYIDVDVFGGARKQSLCPFQFKDSCNTTFTGHLDNCTMAVQNDYKFYLSFENSLCKDYVTEKVFDRMSYSLVITLNQADSSDHLPPHSTISILRMHEGNRTKFATSPEKLAEYLHYLDEHDDEYLSYFWWRDHYKIARMYQQPMCDLCQKLHDDATTKSYRDMDRWWSGDAECGKMLPLIDEALA